MKSIALLALLGLVDARQVLYLPRPHIIPETFSTAHPKSPANSGLRDMLTHGDWLETNDALVNELLISKRPNVSGLLYDEVQKLMQNILTDFPELMTQESIGKTF